MSNTLTAKVIMDRRQSLFFDYSQLSGADLNIPFSRALERWLETVCDRLPVIHENKE